MHFVQTSNNTKLGNGKFGAETPTLEANSSVLFTRAFVNI